MLMSSRLLGERGSCVSSWKYQSYIWGKSTIPYRIRELEKEGLVNGEHFFVWVDVCKDNNIYVKLSILNHN